MAQCCPTCSQPMPETDLPILDMTGHPGMAVYFRGHKVNLWWQKIIIMHELIKAFPGVAKHDTIASALWGAEPTLSGNKQIHVLTSKLRQEVAHMGLKIVPHRAKGYSLRIVPDARKEPQIRAA